MVDPKEIRALLEPLVAETLEAETAKLRAGVLEGVLERTSRALQRSSETMRAEENARLEAMQAAANARLEEMQAAGNARLEEMQAAGAARLEEMQAAGAARLEEMQAAANARLEEIKAAGAARLETLNLAIAAVQQAGSQTGILQELLDGLARFASRVAVLLVRSERAAGWQSRGFAQSDAVRRLSMDVTSGLAAEMAASRNWVSVETATLDSAFMEAIGAPADGQCVLLPLIVQERLAAVVYADAGQSGDPVESISLDILVRSAGLWVEVVAMRKAIAGRNATVAKAEETAASATAALAAAVAAAAQAAIPTAKPAVMAEQAQEVKELAESRKVAGLSAAAQAAAAPLRPVLAFAKAAESGHAQSSLSIVPDKGSSAARHNASLRNEPDEQRRKAQRFARLLIDEIRLYNEHKLAEGRRERDIYSALKEEIDRSRVIYDKRYTETPVANEDYFDRELLENLAEGDAELLGGSFSR